MKAATKLASSLPFGELDRLVKAIGECKSKSEEDRIITAEVDVLKQRLSDPRLDKSRGREYMVSFFSTFGYNVSSTVAGHGGGRAAQCSMITPVWVQMGCTCRSLPCAVFVFVVFFKLDPALC
jgi:hypothetical protein